MAWRWAVPVAASSFACAVRIFSLAICALVTALFASYSMSASLPFDSARRLAASSDLRAFAMSVAATPARGEFSTAGTAVRAVSSDSLRGGALLHAASIAAIATLKTTRLLGFITLTSSMHSDDVAQRCVGVLRLSLIHISE